MLDILAWAERFIAIPSVSRDGNGAMARAAAELLAEAGLHARLVPTELDGTQHFTVLADAGPDVGEVPGLLLLTHLDTVPPGDGAAWTETAGDPFQPTRRGDQLFGLGSADAKVDLVCKAAALAEIAHDTLRRPIRVVGTFAEEIGLLGARALVASGATRGFQWALVGEPSELVAMTAHKGYTVFRATVPLERAATAEGAVETHVLRGASAHSSTPQLGRNAIEDALGRLADPGVGALVDLAGGGATNQVPEHCSLAVRAAGGPADPRPAYDPAPLVDFHRAWRGLLASLAEHKDPDFDPDHTVGNLGRVALEPGRAILTFDLRPIPSMDAQEAVSALAGTAEIEVMRTNPSLATPRDSRLVEALAGAQVAAGLGRRIGTKATCTEAGLLAEAGLEAVVFGPGPSIGNVHKPNEHTRISELGLARDVYRETIRSLCTEEDGACSS